MRSGGDYEDSRLSGTTGHGSGIAGGSIADSTPGAHSSPYGSNLDPRVDGGKKSIVKLHW